MTSTRLLIIEVLDSEDGVNEASYARIFKICRDQGWTDILEQIDGVNNMYYFRQANAAEFLRAATYNS